MAGQLKEVKAAEAAAVAQEAAKAAAAQEEAKRKEAAAAQEADKRKEKDEKESSGAAVPAIPSDPRQLVVYGRSIGMNSAEVGAYVAHWQATLAQQANLTKKSE